MGGREGHIWRGFCVAVAPGRAAAVLPQGSTMKPNRLGGVDIKTPDGRGVRFDADGVLTGLREP